MPDAPINRTRARIAGGNLRRYAPSVAGHWHRRAAEADPRMQ